ncbi:GNAT family N-acetyltransferase, partial [Micromonospora aurantiaca (nom. illeg.)]|uniref:GNAT family N-acetyltransferase n=2 Tax=Micromonosporaceae TaxID=28056 RepID=UPI0038138C63
ATAALRALLREVPHRPLHARAAKDNAASLAVLRKCGFVVIGEDSGYAAGRGTEVEEYVLELPAEGADQADR